MRAAWADLAFPVLPDPVMRRELLGVSRRAGTYFARCAYVFILGFVAWIAWQVAASWDMSYSRLARMGRDMFHAFAITQGVLVALASTVCASDLVSKEVRGGTLGLLMLTPLGRRRILYGKFKAAMSTMLAFVLSGLPVLAISVYLGGVTAGDLAVVTALTLGIGVFCGSVATLASSFFRSAYMPFVVTAVALTLYCIAPFIILESVSYRDQADLWSLAAWTNPFYAMITFLLGDVYGSAKASWIPAAIFAAGAAVAMLEVAGWRMARLALAEPRKPLLRRVFASMDGFFEKINPGGIRLFSGRTGAAWASNPVLWKELSFRTAGKARYFVRIAVALVVVWAGILLLSEGSILDVEFYIGAIVTTMILLELSAIGLAAGAFANEKEEGKWEILLSTPLPGSKIVWAKLLGVGAGLAPLVVVLAAVCLPLLFFADWPAPLLLCLWTSALFVLFTVLTAAFFSLRFARTRSAFALTLLVVICLLGLVWILIIAAWLMFFGPRGEVIPAYLFFSINPMGYFIPLELMDQRGYGYSREPWGYAVAAWPIYTAIYGGACAWLVWIMTRRFDRFARRTR